MSATYKCCKSSFHAYFCVTCHGVFHKSCFEKKKTASIIESYKVYCSKQCQEAANREGEEELRAIIVELQEELQLRDNQILRNQRRSAAFEDDVIEIENTYNAEIIHKTEIIKTLEKRLEDQQKEKFETGDASELRVKIGNLQKLNEALQNKFKLLQEERDKLEEKVSHMKDSLETVKDNTGTSSRSLEKWKREFSHQETQTTITSTTLFHHDGSNQISKETTDRNRTLQNHCSDQIPEDARRRVLVLGDHSARNSASMLSNLLNSNTHIVTGLSKPGANLTELSNSIFQMTRDCTSQDTIIIFIHVNRQCNINRFDFNKILNVSKYMNLIINLKCNLGYAYNADLLKYVNRLIYQFNGENTSSIRILYNLKKQNYYMSQLSNCKHLIPYVMYNLSHKLTLKSVKMCEVSKSEMMVKETSCLGDLTENQGRLVDGNNFLEMPQTLHMGNN